MITINELQKRERESIESDKNFIASDTDIAYAMGKISLETYKKCNAKEDISGIDKLTIEKCGSIENRKKLGLMNYPNYKEKMGGVK